jgi:uncharacterized membrane protein
MEALSDGVIAIAITIMVLELKVPHGEDLASLKPLAPVFFSYALSFINLGIYWNNHHHLLRLVKHIDGRSMWANLHLLFWLSLIPFCTSWIGSHTHAAVPAALYALCLGMAGVAYFILSRLLIAVGKENKELAKALGQDRKGILSVALYAVSVGFAFVSTIITYLLIGIVALIWFIPDTRLENRLKQHAKEGIVED